MPRQNFSNSSGGQWNFPVSTPPKTSFANADTMMLRPSSLLALVAVVCSLWGTVEASLGDRLPEFRECVQVRVPPYASCTTTTTTKKKEVRDKAPWDWNIVILCLSPSPV